MRYITAIFLMLLAALTPLYFVELSPRQEVACAIDSTTLSRRVRIIAAGDLMQHTPQIKAAQRTANSYDYNQSFQHVAPLFRAADLAIVNLETTLSPTGPYSGYPCFCSPAEVAVAMNDMGIDVVALANNHCCDQGAKGIRATTNIIDSLEIRRIGVWRDSTDYNSNRICRLNICGISFAIVNYTYGTNGIPTPRGMVVAKLDTMTMARDFQIIARDSIDCTIAIVHWGNEYERKPNNSQLNLESFMQRHGVDIIIGSHPHVVQAAKCDSVQGVTLYSLGNFVSNQRKRYCDGGLIATIDVERKYNGEMRYELNIEPVWVQKPHYTIIPQSIGDTLTMNRADRDAYQLFISDCASSQ